MASALLVLSTLTVGCASAAEHESSAAGSAAAIARANRDLAAKGERNANDIASAIANGGGLEILPDPPFGYSTEEPLIFRKPGEPARVRTVKTRCTFDPQILNARPAKMNMAELGLESRQPAGLSMEDGRLDDPKVIILTGERASLVQNSSVGIVGLSNGEFFVIMPCVRPYASDCRKPFRKANLKPAEIPDLPDAEFVHADKIGFARTGAGLSTRYVGLWKQGGDWLIAKFTIPAGGARPSPAIPLMKSSLPVRSIDYFPSPDTPSGSVTLVQEAGRSIRVIKFDWWHG